MKFKNENHQLYYEKFMSKAKVKTSDKERQSLFYLLSLLSDTRNNINDLYDFENNWINPEGLCRGWQTGGSIRTTKLAFNLYNGWDGNEDEDYSPLNLFNASGDNLEYLLEAVRIRFS